MFRPGASDGVPAVDFETLPDSKPGPVTLRRDVVARLPPAAWSPDDGRPPE